jgi:hypothetical protein
MRARPPLVATGNLSFCFLWEVATGLDIEVLFRVCFHLRVVTLRSFGLVFRTANVSNVHVLYWSVFSLIILRVML